MIYLDNAATTKLDPDVLEVMMPYLTEQYGNASTLYKLGRDARSAIDRAREQVAAFMGCQPEQVIFTSGGSEGNNLVFHGVAPHLEKIGKTHILVSEVEHDSVINAAKALCIKRQFECDFLGVNQSKMVDFEVISREIMPDTGFLSVMRTNNETGIINPIEDIGERCQKMGILFHTDAVQAAGGEKLNVDKFHCDFMTISSHKLHGPKGVGAVFARNPGILSPIIYGGHGQEFGLRGGTENVAGIVGFGYACEKAARFLESYESFMDIQKQSFYTTFVERLASHGISQSIVHVNGSENTSHKILNLSIDGIDSETLLLMLDSKGVCVSAGSACRTGINEPSRVLLAIGLSDPQARSSVRISFSRDNTNTEIMGAASLMADCVFALKEYVQ